MPDRVELVIGLVFLGIAIFAFGYYLLNGILAGKNIVIAGFAAVLAFVDIFHYCREKRKAKRKNP
jgi:hypothetical protein